MESQYLSVLRDLKDVRTSKPKIKKLVHKVYHFFRSSEFQCTVKGCGESHVVHDFSLN
jgi:hypothetical protein